MTRIVEIFMLIQNNTKHNNYYLNLRDDTTIVTLQSMVSKTCALR